MYFLMSKNTNTTVEVGEEQKMWKAFQASWISLCQLNRKKNWFTTSLIPIRQKMCAG